jgi:glycosyltransferase involved in cell wall biosynthesis
MGIPEPPRSGPPTAVTLVVPVCNERDNLARLLGSVDATGASLRDVCRLELLLVDDGSTDGSWDEMQRLCRGRPHTRLLRHDHNRGVAAAIMTGIRAAGTEVVASIDCDGSYDPAELGAMLPLLQGADLVTASPYHPRGSVQGVPRWRLLLSRGLSRMYRVATGAPLHTFTSCCRVYRKSSVAPLELAHGDFRGVAELLLALLERGGVVVEHPARLGTRQRGTSKMKLLRTIRGHLGLLWRLVRRRMK